MKKIYEKPVVELTVFDVEDVITTSSITLIDTTNQDLMNTNAINNLKSEIAKVKNGYHTGIGNWQ